MKFMTQVNTAPVASIVLLESIQNHVEVSAPRIPGVPFLLRGRVPWPLVPVIDDVYCILHAMVRLQLHVVARLQSFEGNQVAKALVLTGTMALTAAKLQIGRLGDHLHQSVITTTKVPFQIVKSCAFKIMVWISVKQSNGTKMLNAELSCVLRTH